VKIKSMAPQNLTRFFVVVSDAVPHRERGPKDIVKEKKSRVNLVAFCARVMEGGKGRK
jgi:hypothetical protein